jgi:hypothetical protein
VTSITRELARERSDGQNFGVFDGECFGARLCVIDGNDVATAVSCVGINQLHAMTNATLTATTAISSGFIFMSCLFRRLHSSARARE